MFFCEFCRIFKNIFSFDRAPRDDCFLCLSVNYENFFRAPLGNCFIHVKVAEFQLPDTIKNYFTGAFQAFYTRTRSSHSKAFIYLKSLKTICEEVNLRWSCKMLTIKFTKKSRHAFCLHFLSMHHDYFFQRGFESVRARFLSGNNKRKVMLLVIYLFNYDSSKSTFFMLNIAFDVLSSTVFVK